MNLSTAQLLAAFGGRVLIVAASVKAFFEKTFRATLPERLGRGDWDGLRFEKLGENVVWFHVASVGELMGIIPVVTKFREQFSDLSVAITTTSATGKAKAIESKLAEFVAFLPLDHPRFVRRALNFLKPRLMVISETELWPNLLFACKKSAVPVLLINGRISDYSFGRYLRYRTFFRPVLGVFEKILVQNEIDQSRFVAIGAESSQVIVSGSTKYDQSVPTISEEALSERCHEMGLAKGAPIFVAGSVRAGEDEIVIEAFRLAKLNCPELQMIIAPRHPERFMAVANLLSRNGISFARRSEGVPPHPVAVVLLDSLGELKRAYGLAAVAFVGATLVDIGGHNPLEPAMWKKPVIVGPYTANVRDAIANLKRKGGLVEVQTAQELAMKLEMLIRNPTAAQAMGEAGYQVWLQNIGATKTVLSEIDRLIKQTTDWQVSSESRSGVSAINESKQASG